MQPFRGPKKTWCLWPRVRGGLPSSRDGDQPSLAVGFISLSQSICTEHVPTLFYELGSSCQQNKAPASKGRRIMVLKHRHTKPIEYIYITSAMKSIMHGIEGWGWWTGWRGHHWAKIHKLQKTLTFDMKLISNILFQFFFFFCINIKLFPNFQDLRR